MSKIEWTGKTWNPTTGCDKVSPGCKHCYAERMSKRLCAMGQAKYQDGFAPTFHADSLDAPLRVRKPTTWFVNSMSDLFHKAFSDEEIATVFAVMAACPQHTFQVLTKRAERMREWFAWCDSLPLASGKDYRDGAPIAGYLGEFAIRSTGGKCNVWRNGKLPHWPLPNVWLGVSAEDQERYNERVADLVHGCPAAVRFVSMEPLLGPINLRGTGRIHLDWVITGGESGPGARPCAEDWIRSIVDQCASADVPCFVKQLGAHTYFGDEVRPHHRTWLKDRKGGDPAEWPADLRVRQFPEVRP